MDNIIIILLTLTSVFLIVAAACFIYIKIKEDEITMNLTKCFTISVSMFIIFALLFTASVLVFRIDKESKLDNHGKNDSVSIETILLEKDAKYKKANIYVGNKKISMNDIKYIEENGESKLLISE